MLKSVLSLFFLIILVSFSFSQESTIRGVILEHETLEPITGAKVMLVGTEHRTITGLDGSFRFRKVPHGDYTITANFITFETYEESFRLSTEKTFNIQLVTESLEFDEVEVIATRSIDSEASARASEKDAMNVINVISAKEIEVSPDITVANVVQRVSGVSLERNSSGDGQNAIVRGMDKRYNYTLVNGVKIPSPDPRNRYVPLDIFPSDLLDRLEVTKALTPDMEGDAIGGVMDMKMKNAPNQFMLNANIGSGYNQIFINEPFRSFDRSTTAINSPRVTNGNDYQAGVEDFQLENIDFEDKQSAPYQIYNLMDGNLDKESDPNQAYKLAVENWEKQLSPNQIYNLSVGNRFFDNKLGVLVAGSYQNTYRGANSLFMSTFINQDDNTPFFEIIQNRKFSVQQVRSGVHTKVDYRFNKDHRLDLYAAMVNLNDYETRTRVDTILLIGRGQGPGTGRIELRERSRQRYQKIYNTTLQGTHKFGKQLKADWSAVYSLATNDDPDMAELKWITAITKDNDGEFIQDPIMYDTDYKRRWLNNTDQDLAGYGNIKYSPKFIGLPLELSTGGMVRFKNRTSVFDEYLLRTSPLFQEWSGTPHDATWNLFNRMGTPTDPLNYDVLENVSAAYAMFKIDLDKLHIMGGVRVENTFFEWQSQAPPQVDGRTGRISYLDVLPSLHFKYMPNKKQNIRASYFSSISRPSFFEVIPYEINEEDFRERGNPFLSRTKADNFDIRYERFSNVLDKIMVGVFYKRIEDPIERSLFIQNQAVFMQSNNFGTAQNMGFEFDFTKYINEFGVRFFYTYTNSEITTSKLVRFRDEDGNLSSREEDQTRPLQGQSAHISNLSFLYKNQKSGTDVQLSTVYTGRRIINVSPYLDNDIWQRAFIQMDLSIEQRITHGIVAYVKINNLLNSPMRADILLENTFNSHQQEYMAHENGIMVREDFYWQTYMVGLKFNLNQYELHKKKQKK